MGQALKRLTLQAFFEWEEQQAERHGFHPGEVFATVGSRRILGTVSLNIVDSLKGQLKGSRCRAFADSRKICIGADTILYPDVFVTCDEADLRTEQVFTAPTVAVEVFSPSSRSYDRGGKFTRYRSLPSLREYLLVDPDTREVRLFRRGADGPFTLHDLSGREHIELQSVDGTLTAAIDVFDGVEPEAGHQASLPI